jgi:glutathione S-transferase
MNTSSACGRRRWAFKRKLHINPKRSEIARERITQVIDWLEDQLRDGRTYLVQDHFSAADITAAALLAPIACPVEHPVYGDPQFAQSMDAAIAPWRGRPALQWVRQMYARHRGSLQGGAFSPQPQRLSA